MDSMHEANRTHWDAIAHEWQVMRDRNAERRAIQITHVARYAANHGAIRYYARHGFIPIAYHPGDSGLDDKGQADLYKELKSNDRQVADGKDVGGH